MVNVFLEPNFDRKYDIAMENAKSNNSGTAKSKNEQQKLEEFILKKEQQNKILKKMLEKRDENKNELESNSN